MTRRERRARELVQRTLEAYPAGVFEPEFAHAWTALMGAWLDEPGIALSQEAYELVDRAVAVVDGEVHGVVPDLARRLAASLASAGSPEFPVEAVTPEIRAEFRGAEAELERWLALVEQEAP